MTYTPPPQPQNSFRVTLELKSSGQTLDSVLFDALKQQTENQALNEISKAQYKKLFTNKKVLIKGQNARAKSLINSGTTYVDILLE